MVVNINPEDIVFIISPLTHFQQKLSFSYIFSSCFLESMYITVYTVSANETERSLNHSCSLHVCAISLWGFSMDNYVSPNVPFKISLSSMKDFCPGRRFEKIFSNLKILVSIYYLLPMRQSAIASFLCVLWLCIFFC